MDLLALNMKSKSLYPRLMGNHRNRFERMSEKKVGEKNNKTLYSGHDMAIAILKSLKVWLVTGNL